MITQINNFTFKSFKDYTGPIDKPFKEKNIIFGYNGKGKSSLAKGLLDEFKKDTSFSENNFRFFNKDYIKNSLLLKESNNIKGIIANFGKQNVDIEKEIAQKSGLVIDTALLEKELKQIETKINYEIELIFTNKKGNSSIKRKSAATLESLFVSYENDLNSALKLSKKENIKDIKSTSEYEKELETLNNTIIISFELITNEEIEELYRIMQSEYNKNEIPSSKLLKWLESGIEIHKNTNDNKCKFCGNTIHLEDIEKRIKGYLNDKKQQDLIRLDNICKKLETIISKKEQLSTNKTTLGNIIGEKVFSHYENIEEQIKGFSSLLDNIRKKLSNFEESFSIDINLIQESNKLIINNISDINKIKEEKEKNLNTIIEKSNDIVKGSIAKDILQSPIIKNEYEEYKKKKEEIDKAKTHNTTIENEIIALKKSKSTTSDFANFINELLKNLEIGFFLDIKDNNYIIKHRKDNTILKIDDVSEGENNLLALLFFYYELFNDKEQTKFKDEIKLIILDDPISSVDDINKVYVLELIKKILLIRNPQVFVFTHVWSDFCNLCYGKKDNDKEGAKTPYRFYEVKKNSDGSLITNTKYNETPYKHDFKEINEFSKKNTTDDLDECEIYHYPNVMRKVLEEFMKFKVSNSSPTLNNINNVKIALCGEVNKCSINDELQIATLLDVCNILSHSFARNSEQILKSAKYLMKKIADIDKNHFANMTN